MNNGIPTAAAIMAPNGTRKEFDWFQSAISEHFRSSSPTPHEAEINFFSGGIETMKLSVNIFDTPDLFDTSWQIQKYLEAIAVNKSFMFALPYLSFFY